MIAMFDIYIIIFLRYIIFIFQYLNYSSICFLILLAWDKDLLDLFSLLNVLQIFNYILCLKYTIFIAIHYAYYIYKFN